MNKRTVSLDFVVRWILLSTLTLLVLISQARADIGSDWLAAQFQADGSITAPTDIATSYQSTAETLRLWQALGENNRAIIPPALQFLDKEPYHGTEYLARLILVKKGAGYGVTDLVDELLLRPNNDGGFGELQGYHSTALDSAFALEALHSSGYGASETAYNAVDFLLRSQHAGGGWAIGDNEPDVYVTAQALLALLPYANSFSNVSGALTTAQNFLLSQRNAADLWGEDFCTAMVLLALKSSLADSGIIQADIDMLKNRQSADGSWSGDVFTTALALQLLALADNPVANPTLSALQGRVIDGDTGLALAGVRVLLQGVSQHEALTSPDGNFLISSLPPGNYKATFSLTNYGTLVASTVLTAGKVTDLGELNLLKTSGNSSTATVKGSVTDAETGLPLQGVLLTAGSQSIVTGTDGSYQLSNVAPGVISVSAQLSGYVSVSTQTELNGGSILVFSPALTPTAGQSTQTGLFGVIKEAETGLPLQGVSIGVSGSTNMSVTTDAAGAYNIRFLTAGTVDIAVSLPGYDIVKARLGVSEATRQEFSPQLYRSGTTPPNANTASVGGIVLDSTTNQPLTGVALQATHDALTETLHTDGSGHFEVVGIADAEVTLSFSKTDYQPVTLILPIQPLRALDMGQIRMRPKTADVLLPDLVTETLTEQNVTTDPQTLEITGTLQATVKNRGTAITGSFVELLAYYDADHNDNYDADVDTALGSAHLSGPLPVNAVETVAISIAGTVAFRDAPVKIWVDSLGTAVESDESNNVSTTASACKGEPLPVGTFDPVLKWHWSGSNYLPSYNQVMSTPVVAQLNDDNGDGLINSGDIPDIVFNAFSGGGYLGAAVLRAVSGKDGSEIWPQAPRWVGGVYGAAVGDIDHDGLVEIVIGGAYRTGLVAFENDGTVKWSVPASGDAQPALADLDHDGQVEIVYGRHVFNADGSLRWSASHNDPIPVIADLDGDGSLDIVRNGIAYNHDGTVKWNSGTNGLWSGVGNFDDDPYPEIITGYSKIYALEHTGAVKWGPVAVPGGGGGPITIADFDGDGQPEIGTAGARYYAVFETDGSLKWLSSTQDYSSESTGSSLFDFEGDGKAEVLYGDELKFRIYAGDTGTILYEIPNPSGTVHEYPVVADVDNDSHAEIVVVSNNYYKPGTTGIRVFENRNDDWMPTRSIWNQHAYHIDNVNDDGTIPQFEARSWQSHNTYRLNTFPNRNVLDQSDLSVSRLQLLDKGFGQRPSLSVRVGNGGLAAPIRNVALAFYQGDPSAGGVLLGSMNLTGLAAGEYRDVTFDNVALVNNDDIYAVIDPAAQIAECNESNNSMSMPMLNATVLGQVRIATDAAEYPANNPVQLMATVENSGSLTASYRAELHIKDAAGQLVADFPIQTVTGLNGGKSIVLHENWVTGTMLTGHYEAYARLLDTRGRVLDEATAPFQIVAPAALIDGRIVTDKPLYAAWDTVGIDARVENSTTNAIQAPTRVVITVATPDGKTILNETRSVGELQPGALQNLNLSLNLADAVSGTYPVTMTVQDAVSRATLITRGATFRVERTALQALTGSVTANPLQVYQGDPVNCLDQAQNRSASALPAVLLTRELVRADNEQVLGTASNPVDFPGNGQWAEPRSMATGDLAVGTYACVLLAQLQGSTQRLGAALFDVREPPVRIDATIEPGTHGRVLALLDAGTAEDPLGQNHTPALNLQRTYLEKLLTDAGWSYTIVTDADAFTRELHSGGYVIYLLLSEAVKLPETVQQEVREAVNRGEGLIEAGGHDQRQGRIDEALGLKFQGKYPHMDGLVIDPNAFTAEGSVALQLTDKTLRFTLNGASSVGRFSQGGQATTALALAERRYGLGRTVHAGYDLLAEASLAEADPRHGQLLLDMLQRVHPSSLLPLAHGVYPVMITLHNQGIATPGRITLTVPDNAGVIDAGGASEEANQLQWSFNLAEDATVTWTVWLQLPETPVTLNATVESGHDGDYKRQQELMLNVIPQQSDDLQASIDALAPLTDKAYQQVRKYLGWAQTARQAGDWAAEVDALRRAADALIPISGDTAAGIRLSVDRALRSAAMQLPVTP